MFKIYDTRLSYVAVRYARLLKARVTETALRNALETCTYYPTLRSLTKTFAGFGIRGNAFKVAGADLERLSPPFLAWIEVNEKDKDFALVTRMSGESVSYIYSSHSETTISRQAFHRVFAGVVWQAEPGAQGGEAGYESHRRKEQLQRTGGIILISGALLLLTGLIYANITPGTGPLFVFLLLLKAAGCVIACFLLLYTIDKNDASVKRICAKEGQSATGCDAVLGSRASNIFGIGLGELVFFYFSATGLMLLYPLFTGAMKIFLLALANACAIPFVLFSLYYQWRVVKSWCRLCLATSGAVLLESGVFLVVHWAKVVPVHIAMNDFAAASACVLLPVVAWYALKPVLIRSRQYSYVSAAYSRMENDPGIFELLLHRQPAIYPDWQKHGFVTGNENGSTDIVMVSDLYCNPCRNAHTSIGEMVGKNKKVQWRIIFVNSGRNAPGGDGVVAHLLALAQNGTDMVPVLDEWYRHHDPKALLRRYPVTDAQISVQKSKEADMNAWCLSAGISFTPAIYINGYLLPDNYRPEDLKNIL